MILEDIREHLDLLIHGDHEFLLVYSSIPSFGRQPGDFAHRLFEALLDIAGGEKTLVFPTYNLSGQTIHRQFTTSGLLSQLALDSNLGVRSASILHSHFAIGRNARTFDNEFLGSFGFGSDFELLLKKDTLQVMLGCGLSKAGTILHHAESLASVPYRRIQLLEKKVVEDGETRTVNFPYPVRTLDSVEEDFSTIENSLVTNKKLRSSSVRYGSSQAIGLIELFDEAMSCLKRSPWSLTRQRQE